MINLRESMGPGRDRTRDPWICSQIRICNQTRYRLRYAARFKGLVKQDIKNIALLERTLSTAFNKTKTKQRTPTNNYESTVLERTATCATWDSRFHMSQKLMVSNYHLSAFTMPLPY